MSTVAVADAGPIIHLAEADLLDLFDVLDELLVPETVLHEVAVGGTPDGFDRLEREVVRPDTDVVGDTDLDAGERTALAAALTHDAALLTDDLDARDRANDRSVEVHGSLGVIALASADGRIDREAAAAAMHTLQHETSLFVTDAVVERGIRQLYDQ